MNRVTKHIQCVHLVRLIKLNTWISPLLLLFVHSTSTDVTRNTCIAEPRVALEGGGVVARKTLGMGEREKQRKLSTCSRRREGKGPHRL